MKPVICFYKNNLYLFSKDYELIQCQNVESTDSFIQRIEKHFAERMKIIQLNFENGNEEVFQNQKSHYPSYKANVFVLNSFELLSWDEILKKLNAKSNIDSLNFKSLVTKEDFIRKANFVIEEIKKGRLYQANLTAALKAHSKDTSVDIFSFFHKHFNGQYKALLPLNDISVMCFSPELFLNKENNVLSTKPIKGSADQSKNFINSLIENEKENAELSMIVDLLRNDLNSISSEFSSEVVAHRESLQLGYIQHTYSEIAVKCESTLSHVIAKTFPGGSISGCPKIESLKVIREIEDTKRQIYTGSIGWWQNNDFCLNIAIRTLIHHQTNVFYHAGCGIVFDSDPELEWNEYLLKTGALSVK